MAQLDPTDRKDLIETLLWIMQQWGLESSEQVRLLGLPESTPGRALLQYRQGKPIPDEALFVQHAELILSIYRAVASFFPGNPTMANYWVSTPSTLLGGRAPIEIMLADGLAGMQYCLDHLNGEHW